MKATSTDTEKSECETKLGQSGKEQNEPRQNGLPVLEEQLLVTHGRDLGIKNSETRTRKTDVKCE